MSPLPFRYGYSCMLQTEEGEREARWQEKWWVPGSQLGDPCSRCHLRPHCCLHSEARRRERCLRQKGCLFLHPAWIWNKTGNNSSWAGLRRAGWLFDAREPHPLYSPCSGVTPEVRLGGWYHFELPVSRKGFMLLLLPSFCMSIRAAMTEERQPQSTAKETTEPPVSTWGVLGDILDSEKQKSWWFCPPASNPHALLKLERNTPKANTYAFPC